MDYLQVALTVNRECAELVCDLMSEAGALSVTVESAGDEELFDASGSGDPAWRSQKLTALFAENFDTASLIGSLEIHTAPSDIEISPLADQDWERNWLEHFKPFQTGDRMWVCPSWLEPVDPDAINLIIDPGLAFGTGSHNTTLLCLKYLAERYQGGGLVVDYGCGSGILGIAALKLGASEVIAVDVDPKALDATRNNARSNGVAGGMRAAPPQQLPGLLGERQPSLVIANILAGTIMQLKDELVGLCGGINASILLSGILSHQADQIVDAYSDAFSFEKQQQGDWILLIGTARSCGLNVEPSIGNC